MIMTKKEVAAYFKVGVDTIDNWEKNGMPVMRKPKIDPKYDLDDIKKWFYSRESFDKEKKEV